MPTTDISANGLVINKLSKAQYDAIQNPSDTELYLVPDEIDNAPTSGSNNPVKSGGVEINKIIWYSIQPTMLLQIK